LQIANNFETEWNFPNCLGALDGKHIAIECPHNGGSAFYNYKNIHSLTLLAVCDSQYTFTVVEFGGYGKENDASLLSISRFGQAFEQGQLLLPKPRQLGEFKLPYVLVGDGIFPLKSWLMKPYGGKFSFVQHIFTDYLEQGEQLRMHLASMQHGGEFSEDQSEPALTQLKVLSRLHCASIIT